jgi:transcription antitermination factor NusG
MHAHAAHSERFRPTRSSGADRPAAAGEAGGSAWFAVWTRSRHEAVVEQQLTRKGIEAFLPTVPRWSRWKDRRKRIEWPLFPGYCFARVAPAAVRAVVECPGVATVVSFEGKPAVIADDEIESLRTLIATDLRCDPCPFIREGARVEVVTGPLRGVVGHLVRKGAHARLVLSVALVAQAVSVQVDAADVRPY